MRVAGIDKPISALVLGTAFYRSNSKEQWFEILDYFQHLGGTVVDTARMYDTSEIVVGEWLEMRAAREQMVIITKCGHGDNCALSCEDFTAMVTEDLQNSLDCLKSDYIDIYMLHRDIPSIPVAEIMDRLNEEINNGQVNALAASNWEYSRLNEANEYAYKHGIKGFAVVSNNLSLAVPAAPFYTGLVSTDRHGEEWHKRTGIPLFSWSSQARGFFTGRYTAELCNQHDRIENGFTKRMLEVYSTDENLERLRRAQEMGARKGGYAATEVALAWLVHKPFPLVPIVGPHTKEELESCVNALSLKLTAPELKWLNLE